MRGKSIDNTKCVMGRLSHPSGFWWQDFGGWMPTAKKLLVAAGFLTLVVISCRGQESAGTTVTNLWFPVGEQLHYSAYWGVIPAGDLVIASRWINANGRKLIRLTASVKSRPFVSRIYRVDDYVESLVDPATFLPILYYERIQEGKKSTEFSVSFNHASGTAVCSNLKKGTTRIVGIDGDTRDLLSFIYFMGAKTMQVGDEQRLGAFVSGKIYEIRLICVAEEEIKTRLLGVRKCLKMEPKAEFGEVFSHGGRLYLWVTTGDRKICPKVVVDLPVANLRGTLVSLSTEEEPGESVNEGGEE
ncbi:MAG: DUF3108 domain-containing protein [Kiritimatiellae bacterium]|nr:DUF3108 domain-containing protein [Kiritimatiellia bacterium]